VGVHKYGVQTSGFRERSLTTSQIALLAKTLTGLSQSLKTGLIVASLRMPSVELAVAHDSRANLTAGDPHVFKTVPTGTPTDRAGRNLQV